MYNDIVYKKLDQKASDIITKLQNEINKKGYRENMGQKELRAFNDLVDNTNLDNDEKDQLKYMLETTIEHL